MQKTNYLRKMLMIILALSAALLFAVALFLNAPRFGSLPKGERLERVMKSPNYKNGQFQNLSPTVRLATGKSTFRILIEHLFEKPTNLNPIDKIPSDKSDLNALDKNDEIVVWLGHSSYYVQMGGKRVLIDPALLTSAPIYFLNKPFRGSDVYEPQDIPEIDYLIITHDHWDHLDYRTFGALKKRIGMIICPLGVGAHFERWGFEKHRIVEMDWYGTFNDKNLKIYCLPSRHFSGRALNRNQSLWASFMLKSETSSLYAGSDSGYDEHFKKIGEQFPDIDLALVENGQYNKDWAYMHTMPEKLAAAMSELGAKKYICGHNSKFTISKHHWKEPLENAERISKENGFNLLTPMIGEVVRIKNSKPEDFKSWWKDIE